LGTFLLAGTAAGQAMGTDSSALSLAVVNMQSQRAEPLANDSHLYNGTEYISYEKKFRRVEGHQYFLSNEQQKGSIFYDGSLYQDIPLWYDIKLDQVILSYPKTIFKVKLVTEKLQYFTIKNHAFIYVNQAQTDKSTAPIGFYELLLDGPVKVLAKRSKRSNEQLIGNEVVLYFEQTDKFFIQKSDKLYPVNGKKSLLAIFPEKKKELRRYAATNKLKFKKVTQEEDFISLVKYFSSL
jgi:hypothetical protein